MAFDVNTYFTLAYLKESVARVRKHFPDVSIKSAYVHHYHRDQYEFHGPIIKGEKRFYDGTISAHDKYEARSKGWDAWLRSKGITDDK